MPCLRTVLYHPKIWHDHCQHRILLLCCRSVVRIEMPQGSGWQASRSGRVLCGGSVGSSKQMELRLPLGYLEEAVGLPWWEIPDVRKEAGQRIESYHWQSGADCVEKKRYEILLHERRWEAGSFIVRREWCPCMLILKDQTHPREQ